MRCCFFLFWFLFIFWIHIHHKLHNKIHQIDFSYHLFNFFDDNAQQITEERHKKSFFFDWSIETETQRELPTDHNHAFRVIE